MADETVVAISFKDMPSDEDVREAVEKRCRVFAEEFPETTRIEVTLTPDGDGHAAHGHVTGRSTEVAAHGGGNEPAQAADQLLDRLEKQLRKDHDKRIFSRRREARQERNRR